MLSFSILGREAQAHWPLCKRKGCIMHCLALGLLFIFSFTEAVELSCVHDKGKTCCCGARNPCELSTLQCTDPAKQTNKRADERTWASGRGADSLQLMGQLVCLKGTWSVCLVNHLTFLLQAKNSRVKCVDKPTVRAYLRKLFPSPGAICDIQVYCMDSLNKRIHWQHLLEISVRDAFHTAGI